MRIHPNDVLAAGTEVRVNSMKGTIVKHEEKRDQFGGPIIVHTVRFTQRLHRLIANHWTYRPMARPITQTVNYAFIDVTPSEPRKALP